MTFDITYRNVILYGGSITKKIDELNKPDAIAKEPLSSEEQIGLLQELEQKLNKLDQVMADGLVRMKNANK